MADAKAIEDCKREISLLQVWISLILKSKLIIEILLAIESSECN
jgi:hypothetical protein